jgi:hypothetical protein
MIVFFTDPDKRKFPEEESETESKQPRRDVKEGQQDEGMTIV